ncbi:MAG TPA: HWE histidine kinase domain-containing protein [Bauldia sp.]|nr:HWE histidine kinase domain-containing protein [Bauldia sp.]
MGFAPEGVGQGIPEMGEPTLILERMNDGFYAIDRDWRFLLINRSAELFWGRQRKDMLGQDMRSVFTKFVGSPSHQAHQRAFDTGLTQTIQTISTATGAPVELQIFPFSGGLSIYFLDVSRRLQMERDLRERDEILTLAELSAGIGIWVADLTTGMVRGTPQFFRLMGLEPESGEVSIEVPRSVRHPDDRKRVMLGFQEALAEGRDTYEVEYRVVLPSGEERWIFGRGIVVRDAEGRPWRYSGVDIDITHRKRQEEHLRLVSRELVHRTNNLLAIIQSMIRQTALAAEDVETFEARLSARIMGLGESNAILVRQDWRGVLLEELVRAQLKAFLDPDDKRLSLSGPPVFLTPRAVQNIGLALHELGTNAIKYGALSVQDGAVRIGWAYEEERGKGLRLIWREVRGPPVAIPRRSGFGRAVVEQLVPRALATEASLHFDPDGVVWTIVIPDTEVAPPPDGTGV